MFCFAGYHMLTDGDSSQSTSNFQIPLFFKSFLCARVDNERLASVLSTNVPLA